MKKEVSKKSLPLVNVYPTSDHSTLGEISIIFEIIIISLMHDHE